jgi:hypothetical protein
MPNLVILHKPRNVAIRDMEINQAYICAGNKSLLSVKMDKLYICAEKGEKDTTLTVVEDDHEIVIPNVDIWHCAFHPVEVVGTVGDKTHVRYV